MVNRYILPLGLAVTGLAVFDGQTAHFARGEEHAIAPGEIGSRLPDFSVKDLKRRSLRTADFRGKVVLIDFWATWCAPCEKEMPGYQMLVDRYGSQGLVVVGLKADMMNDTEDPLHFAHRVGVRYPLVVATTDLNQKFGGIEGLPTTLLYDRAGFLRKKVIGFEYTSVFEAELKPLLARR
jgi:thiol-disulfide isomerase/thioredoxin